MDLKGKESELRVLIIRWCAEEAIAPPGKRVNVVVDLSLEDVSQAEVAIDTAGKTYSAEWGAIRPHLTDKAADEFLAFFEGKEDVWISRDNLTDRLDQNVCGKVVRLNKMFKEKRFGDAVTGWRFRVGCKRGCKLVPNPKYP